MKKKYTAPLLSLMRVEGPLMSPTSPMGTTLFSDPATQPAYVRHRNRQWDDDEDDDLF